MSGATEAHPDPDEKPKKRSLLVWVSCLSRWRFVLFASITLVIANLLQVLVLEFLVVHFQIALPKEDPVAKLKEKYGVAGLLFCGVVAIPWFETLLGQALPMVLTRALVKPEVPYMVLATVWFACLHGLGVDPGWEFMILSHLVGSFILAGTFLHGWYHSWWRGIWMTTIVHTAGNLTLFLYELVVEPH
jgi:hypothetical protein